ncbi:MAG: tetratricopeptide repeat protein [Myxococcota bacterium]
MNLRILALTLLVTTGGVASAQSLQDVFTRANESAFAGNHDDAIRDLQRLLDAGVRDPDVEFNLATVHAQAGHFGAAIRHFERTLRLRPGDDDAEQGLDDARRVLADRRARAEGEAEVDTGGGFGDALVRPFTEPVLAWSLLVLELLFLVLLFVRARASKGSGLRLGTTLIAAVTFLLTLGAGVALLTERGAFHEGDDAIVVADRVTLREGPDERAAPRGEAREGDWARVLDEDEGYVLIRIRNKQGWADAQSVGRL